MDGSKAVTLVMITTVLLSAGAWTAVVLLGGGGGLATAAMFAVMWAGIDQASRLGLRHYRAEQKD